MPKKADTKKVKTTTTNAKSSATKKATPKKSFVKKTNVKKVAVKKAPAKKVAVKKAPAKKVSVKKAPAKKTAAKKVAAKKTPAKKVSAKKRSTPISSYQGRKGEKYMSAAMKKHFLAVLIDWREHLKEEMQKTFDHLKNKGESYADPIDRASQEEEFAFELRTRDRERKLISKIAMSLEQIKQDDYGYCYACGIEIGVKRLEARPTATHCIDCKTLDEIKEKQLGG
jgi:DnaK suppressor protein